MTFAVVLAYPKRHRHCALVRTTGKHCASDKVLLQNPPANMTDYITKYD